MGARRHRGRRGIGREAGAEREAGADALGGGEDVRGDARPLVGEQLAGAPHAALHLVIDEQQAVLVAQCAQALEEAGRRRADAALALDRLDEDRRRLRPDRLLRRREVAERHLVEALDLRAEALEVLLLAAGGDGGERAAVEGALEGDDAEPLWAAFRILVVARGLDRRLQRLGAGIGEEDAVGEARRRQPVGQLLAIRDAVEVGDVPDLRRLLLQRRDEVGMGMAERVHRDAGAEVEIASPVGTLQPRTLASLEGEIDAREGAEQVLRRRAEGRSGGDGLDLGSVAAGHGRGPLAPARENSGDQPRRSRRRRRRAPENKSCRPGRRHVHATFKPQGGWSVNGGVVCMERCAGSRDPSFAALSWGHSRPCPGNPRDAAANGATALGGVHAVRDGFPGQARE